MRKSRSCEVAWIRQSSFCDSGCVLAAKDVVSTSGKSANVVRALEVGRECGAVTMAFTGRNGGAVSKAADYTFKAPDAATPRIQELHLLAWHGICEVVEAAMVSKSELERTGT